MKRLGTAEYSIPADVLARGTERTSTGAPSAEWLLVDTLWLKLDEVNTRGTGEVAADRGPKGTSTLVLLARWFPAWADVLSSARRLVLDGRAYNIRSCVEGPADGTARTLRLEAQAVGA